MAATALGPYSPASMAASLASGAAAIEWSRFLLRLRTSRQHGAYLTASRRTRSRLKVDLIREMRPLGAVLNYGSLI